MVYCSARLFDGRSATQTLVQLEAHSQGLRLVWPSGLMSDFTWTQIRSLETGAAGDHLELTNGFLLIYTSPAMRHILRESLAQNAGGFWHRLHWFAITHWKRMALYTLILTGFALVLFYTAFTQAYRLVPIRYDSYLGQQTHQRFLQRMDTCGGESLNHFKRVADSLLKRPSDQFDHPLVILNLSESNAFALPGGRIYLLRGLLESSHSPDEVLGVLAHEMSHGERRHGVQQLIRNAGLVFMVSLVVGGMVEGFDMLEQAETVAEMGTGLMMLRYSRGFEREADRDAVARMQMSGISPAGLDSLLNRIAPASGRWNRLMEILGTHPLSEERSELMRQAVSETQEAPAVLDSLRTHWEQIKRSCDVPPDTTPFWRQIF